MQGDLRQSRNVSIKLEDFTIECRLGEGAYGLVLLASRNGKEYALKEMSKFRLRKLHLEHIALIQKELLRKMNHPGIVQSHFAFQTSSKLYLAMELCGGGQFQNLVMGGMLTEASRRFYFAELVNIIEYLHGIGVVHRDLKPANLMVSERGHLKLIDFGTADVTNTTVLPQSFKQALTLMKKDKENVGQQPQQQRTQRADKIRKRRSTFVGTSFYMSPQLLQFNYCETPADLWAMGCILYYFYYGKGPFSDACQLTLFQKIKTAEFQFPPNPKLTPEAEDLIRKLLVRNPEQRLGSCSKQDLSFSALKNHPYFTGINHQTLFQTNPPNFTSSFDDILSMLSKMSLETNIPQAKVKYLQTLVGKMDRFGDKICKLRFSKSRKMEQYQINGLSDEPIVYQLSPQNNIPIAHLLGPNKLSIGPEHLIYRSTQAAQLCEKINGFYSDYSDA